MKKIKVMIVDDHTLVRDGLVAMLKTEHDIQVVGEASNGSEALARIKNMEVDVVIMDIIMSDINGLEATKLIKEHNEKVEVVLLSMEVNEEYVAEGIRNGAKAYLPKDISRSKLLQAIRAVSDGEKYFDDKISQMIFESFYNRSKAKACAHTKPGQKLSKRETEILIMFAEGMSSQEISEKLFISTKTVDAHRYNIMQKLGLKNNTELVRYAIKQGLVEI